MNCLQKTNALFNCSVDKRVLVEIHEMGLGRLKLLYFTRCKIKYRHH